MPSTSQLKKGVQSECLVKVCNSGSMTLVIFDTGSADRFFPGPSNNMIAYSLHKLSVSYIKKSTNVIFLSSCVYSSACSMNHGCWFSFLLYHSGRKKGSLVPRGHHCQGHLSAAVFHCVLVHSSQHAAWLHKTLNAWECPTAGRLRLQQSCCAVPTRVPLPPVPDSLHQLAAHLSLRRTRCLSVICSLEDLSRVSARLLCLLAWICQRVLLVSLCVCVCLSDWQRGQL